MENVSASFHPYFHSCTLPVLPSPHCRLHSVPLWREQEVLSHRCSYSVLVRSSPLAAVSSFMVSPWSLIGQLFSSSLLGALVLLRMTSFAPAFFLLYCPFFPQVFLASPLLLLGHLTCPRASLVYPPVCPPALTFFILSLPNLVLFSSAFLTLS